MTQTVQLDVINSNTGVAFGSTVYQLDGTTVYSAFSTSGWSEAPTGSGAWHNSALTLPDAGGVVAYGVSGNEYNRATFGPATLKASDYTAPDNTGISNIYSRIGAPAGASVSADIATVAGYVDTEVAAIKAKTDNLPSDPADASDIATSFASIAATLSTIAGYIDTEVAAIKAKTDNLPSDPADASDIAASFSSVSTTLATIAGYIDTEVAAIKAKTDNLPAAPAAVSDIPTTTQINTALSTAHGAGSWATATGFATPSDVTSAQTAILAAIAALNDLDTSDITAAIQSMSIETGHSFLVVLQRMYAVLRNKFLADDREAPATIIYYAPDGTTVRVTHTLSAAGDGEVRNVS